MKPIDRILQQEANVYLRTKLGLRGGLVEDFGSNYYTYFSEIRVLHRVPDAVSVYDRGARISIGDNTIWFGKETLLNYIQQTRQKMRAWGKT